MGYYSTLSGEISISPPLSPETTDPSLCTNPAGVYSIMLDLSDPQATLIVSATDENCKHYHIAAELAGIVKIYPGHEFRGELVRSGEEQGDIERYRVANGQVISERALLAWPDGTPVPSEYL